MEREREREWSCVAALESGRLVTLTLSLSLSLSLSRKARSHADREVRGGWCSMLAALYDHQDVKRFLQNVEAQHERPDTADSKEQPQLCCGLPWFSRRRR